MKALLLLNTKLVVWMLPLPRLADMDRIKADPVLSEELLIAPYFCTYYSASTLRTAVMSDVRVRRALSMAIDRQGLIDNVTKGEQDPAQWFSRPGLAGAPTLEEYPDLGVKSDPEAGQLLNCRNTWTKPARLLLIST